MTSSQIFILRSPINDLVRLFCIIFCESTSTNNFGIYLSALKCIKICVPS